MNHLRHQRMLHFIKLGFILRLSQRYPSGQPTQRFLSLKGLLLYDALKVRLEVIWIDDGTSFAGEALFFVI